MSLVKLLQQEAPKGHRVDRVAQAYEHMDPDNQDAFRVLILDPDWSAGQIAEAMNAMGYQDIDDNKVNHFRRKLRAGKVTL